MSVRDMSLQRFLKIKLTFCLYPLNATSDDSPCSGDVVGSETSFSCVANCRTYVLCSLCHESATSTVHGVRVQRKLPAMFLRT